MAGKGRRGGLGLFLAAEFLLLGVGGAAAQGPADYRLLVLDRSQLKWAAAAGAPAGVTYAVATSPMTFAGARNCPAIAPVAGLLAASGIARPAFDGELRAAFAAWSKVANITFSEAAPDRADILIGAEASPRGRAFTNVEYKPDAVAGTGRLTRSVICLNPAERWKIGFDGNLDVYDLRYTLTHEIGHAIGLDHPSGFAELMGFRYLERFSGPQPGDIAGAVALYGPAPGAATGAAGVGEPPRAQPTLAIGAGSN
ncbi:MAG TPA: matrixin family metalloprotease [Bauldia sp.]|nr:matrixin family metalloprotease [Bauldia sp.]